MADPAAALAAVAAGALLVDVRSATEYEARHIDAAVSLPIGAALDAALADTDGGPLRCDDGTLRPVVVHCASGARSASAAAQPTSLTRRLMGAMVVRQQRQPADQAQSSH